MSSLRMESNKNYEFIGTYDEVLKRTENSLRYLLLGNGFSVAYDKNKFSFKNLFDYAKKNVISHNSPIMKHFEELQSYDFEIIIKYLENALLVLKNYPKENQSNEILNNIKQDINSLKEYLVMAITKLHPEFFYDIKKAEYIKCIDFIKEFNGIFTLNYDLLLNWVILEYLDNNKLQNNRLIVDDGFRGRNKLIYNHINRFIYFRQTIFYLHGALHLFFDGIDVIKNYYDENQKATLLEQTKFNIQIDNYPIFVSEGDAKKKLMKIKNNLYLNLGLQKFKCPNFSDGRNLRYILNQEYFKNRSLVIFGTILDKDEHIVDAIVKGRYKNIYIGIRNKNKIYSCNHIISKLKDTDKNLFFYDFTTVNVWR
ncbi:DUF4917 domain-containing protein [Aliarcobacter trophiarum LMG 25534]|uniref:DUF4917 domain-containing protein n=1 Tax=Aliarcobacter trophiarum LMG 25534 TaxID=1032241 RepID=A0AAD0VM68_9BACT|nr:DUF4917 domain-containing protein [Aliarcobacter trophiarum LMG 25534]